MMLAPLLPPGRTRCPIIGAKTPGLKRSRLNKKEKRPMASIRFRWIRFWQRSTARLVLLVAAFATLPPFHAAEVRGQVLTSRTVKLIVNYPAGSGTGDMLARFMSEWLAHKWMRPVVVENIPGLTGRIGAEAVYGAE